MTRADQIRTILRRYGVRSHYRATSEAKAARYAVWADGEVVTAPGSHSEMHRRLESFVVHELLAMIDQFPATGEDGAAAVAHGGGGNL